MANYKLVKAPEWYEGLKYGRGYAYEHIILACEKYGYTEVPEGFQVHHLDGDKRNNDPENLIILTKEQHTRLHHKGKHLTSEIKEKMRETRGKKVQCLETGEVYNSASDASRALGLWRGAVGEAIRLDIKCAGYHFVYLEKVENIKEEKGDNAIMVIKELMNKFIELKERLYEISDKEPQLDLIYYYSY